MITLIGDSTMTDVYCKYCGAYICSVNDTDIETTQDTCNICLEEELISQ
jgi:hypothetical protein